MSLVDESAFKSLQAAGSLFILVVFQQVGIGHVDVLVELNEKFSCSSTCPLEQFMALIVPFP